VVAVEANLLCVNCENPEAMTGDDQRLAVPAVAGTTRLSRLRPLGVRFVNPVMRRAAGRLPGFAILSYTGRRTGRTYRTPINVFRRGDQYVFVLTYGSAESQWVKNILTTGGCEMRRMGRDVHLVEPELIVDPTLSLVPRPLRFMGRLAGVTEFLRMTADRSAEG
jgi:deazaflavin-dependent oxidoreductase (nitroreductase family)